MKKFLTLFITGSAFFIIFILFSFLVHKNIFTAFDFDTTVKLQDNISRRFDDLFSWFSTIGSFEVMSFMVLMLLTYFMIKRKFLAAISAGFLYFIFHVIEIYGKFFVDHLPPPEFMLRTKRMIEFPQFHVRAEFSYPSGHSGRTVFLSVMLITLIWVSLNKTKSLRLLRLPIIAGILLFDSVMLTSRVYLGEHWTTDIIGGAILGAAFALVSISFYFRLPREK